jgi:hypothetical protein
LNKFINRRRLRGDRRLGGGGLGRWRDVVGNGGSQRLDVRLLDRWGCYGMRIILWGDFERRGSRFDGRGELGSFGGPGFGIVDGGLFGGAFARGFYEVRGGLGRGGIRSGGSGLGAGRFNGRIDGCLYGWLGG